MCDWHAPPPLDIQLYHSETLELMLRRWAKLEKDFKMKNGRYNISKIPDIYDCIKYDVQHNSSLKLDHTMEIYRLSKALADIVIPQVSHLPHPPAERKQVCLGMAEKTE